MGAIPYALSVSHFVSSVGADAGFAAIVGLAILVLLYFAQARETASLRDRFAEAAEQVRQLELRVTHLSRPQAAESAGVTPAPAPSAAAKRSVPSRTVRPARLEIPMAPAGVGAPALSAATHVIPEDEIAIRPGARRQVAVGAAAGAAGAGAATAVAEREGATPQGSGGAVAAPPGPPPAGPGPGPSTAAGAASGATAAAPNGNGAGGRTPAPAAVPGAQRPPQPPNRQPKPPGARPSGQPGARRPIAAAPAARGRIPRAVLIIAGLIIVAAVVAVLLVATSGSGNQAHNSNSGAISNAPSANKRKKHARAAALTPAQVTVAVLNGTSTSNLAHDVSLKLAGVGYKPGQIATATDQTQTATTVGYLPGERRAALIVAKSLNLGATAIEPATTANRAVACPGTTCSAQVIVTVGSDLASDATSAASSSSAAASSTTP